MPPHDSSEFKELILGTVKLGLSEQGQRSGPNIAGGSWASAGKGGAQAQILQARVGPQREAAASRPKY